jgi:hypothetical protein
MLTVIVSLVPVLLLASVIQVTALEPGTHKVLNKYIADTTVNGFSLDSGHSKHQEALV